MFCLSEPDRQTIEKVLRRGGNLTCDATAKPAGFWNEDHNRTLLGVNCFDAAQRAIREWRMFDTGWTRIAWPDSPIQTGVTVAAVIRHLGFWSVNPARIIRVVDEPRRFGFTYATVDGHAEQGHEQFLVEWLDNGEVWYDLHAFSLPKHWLAWLGYPVTRQLQKRFARDSMRAMRRSVSSVPFG